MPQSLAKAYLHVIFSTKDRQPLIAESWRSELFSILGGTCNSLGCQSLIVGGVDDHVHMLFLLSRTLTMADAIGKIKSASSGWVNVNRKTATHFHWQGGYAAFSVSQSLVEAVREYIRNQAEHHKHVSFQDELREWLRKHELDFDERYCWD